MSMADTPQARVAAFLDGYAGKTDDILTIATAATGHEDVSLLASDVRALLERIAQLEEDRKVLSEIVTRR